MTTTNIVIEKIIEIGPVIIIPSILFLLGLIATRNFVKNLLYCVYVFIGMFGIAIMLTLLINFFTPLINTIVTASAKEFTVVDIGWFASKQVVLNSPINLYIIIAIVAVNLLMLLLPHQIYFRHPLCCFPYQELLPSLLI